MINLKTALVTGGAGLIGSHLVKRLLKGGYKVIVADDLSRGTEDNIKNLGIEHDIIDLTRPALCESVFARNDIQEVYHLAAFLGGVEFIHKYPVEAFQRNMRMNMNVLESCRIFEVEKLLFTSTACVYPVGKQTSPYSRPLKEDDVYPLDPESGYGWAKLLTEFLCRDYIEEYGLNVGIVRMFNVYGPGESYEEGSHVIPMMSRAAINFPRESPTIYGNGYQTRSFIYVEDAVDGILATMKYGINKGAYNIGTEYRYEMIKLASMIVNIVNNKLNKSVKIIFDKYKPTGVLGRAANIDKASEDLNFKLKTPLFEGLEKTIDWIIKDMKVKGVFNG